MNSTVSQCSKNTLFALALKSIFPCSLSICARWCVCVCAFTTIIASLSFFNSTLDSQPNSRPASSPNVKWTKSALFVEHCFQHSHYFVCTEYRPTQACWREAMVIAYKRCQCVMMAWLHQFVWLTLKLAREKTEIKV